MTVYITKWDEGQWTAGRHPNVVQQISYRLFYVLLCGKFFRIQSSETWNDSQQNLVYILSVFAPQLNDNNSTYLIETF